MIVSSLSRIFIQKNTNKIKKFYHDAGSFLFLKQKKFLKIQIPSKKDILLSSQKYEVCDIDDKEDLKLAKILLKNK